MAMGPGCEERDDEFDDFDDDPNTTVLFAHPEIDRPVDGEFDQQSFLDRSGPRHGRRRGADPRDWDMGNRIDDFDGPASPWY